MHCVAGDGVGILAGAILSSLLGLTGLAEVALEYMLGFGFGWTIFQALFMRDGAMAMGGGEMAEMAMEAADKPSPSVPIMTVLSFVALAAGLALAFMG
jgi:Domain of unknown function (DUF4396)